MALYRVWAPELDGTPETAWTVAADSHGCAAIAAHRALVLDSGADIETAYAVVEVDASRVLEQLITVTPIVSYVASRLR